VHAPLESALDYPSFSMRVAEKDVAQLPTILRAIPADRVAAMQAELQKVWAR
jgi:hypothetical protein